MFKLETFALVILLHGTTIVNAQDAGARLAAAQGRLREGDLDAALEQLEPLLDATDLDQQTGRRIRDLAAKILHSRGEANFRRARIAESIADFDRQLELEPQRAAEHWQRGIAYYYAGEYEKGARQFELHQTVNPQDVENAAWHFLCLVRAPQGSVEEARKNLISVTVDPRVPMAQIQQMFAGTITPEDVLRVGERAGGTAKFYADLYAGLFYEALGRFDESLRLVKLAAENSSAGDSFMRYVAQVHVTLRAEEAEKRILRHAVFFKFKLSSSAEDVKRVVEAFRALPTKIKEIREFQSGENVSRSGLSDGLTHCFLLTFEDEAGRAAYLPHADHRAFGAALGPHLDKVFVIDYWGRPQRARLEKELKHAVFVKFKKDTQEADIRSIEAGLAGLPEKIDAIKAFEWGKNNSPETHDEGFTHCFMFTFDSDEALKKYAEDPAHVAVANRLRPTAEKIRVLDFWASDAPVQP
jgi:tetratricopeptide (TPR) repeat protein